jgi:hypothetical protein
MRSHAGTQKQQQHGSPGNRREFPGGAVLARNLNERLRTASNFLVSHRMPLRIKACFLNCFRPSECSKSVTSGLIARQITVFLQPMQVLLCHGLFSGPCTSPARTKSPHAVKFLKALQATIGRKLLIVWDRLQAKSS